MFNLIEWLYLKQKNNLVYYDSLTGAKSRLYYDRVCKKKYLATELEVFFIDIDNLKQINDLQGHYKGSWLLKTVAEQLATVSGVDCVCRYGGDEFLVFGADIDEQALAVISDISYGRCFKEPYECLSSAVKKADDTMYIAKQKKKQKVEKKA